MSEVSAGRPAGCWSGRAVSVRDADAEGGQERMLREAGSGGAAILIASPGCWSAPGPPSGATSPRGVRVVLSSEFPDKACNNLINMGIMLVRMDPEILTNVQDTVEADPGIVLTVDVGSGEVRARGQVLARFEIGAGLRARRTEAANPGHRLGQGGQQHRGLSDGGAGGGETLAGRLLLAQRMLRSARLPGDDRIRLQRRLVAICDAMKAPGADSARSARRLDRLLADLARTSQDGAPEASAPDRDSRGTAGGSGRPARRTR